mmetsp:Transcript_5495/g.17309  ORF Transcript_5495/g.17309 Transcript_5495/m.17309 type:complete len:562 (+) Transcript_5495:1173-2858(+)
MVPPGYEWLVSRLAALAVTRPTDVQRRAIPAALGGKDVLALARTGSGKTIAFGLPMAAHVASRLVNNQSFDDDSCARPLALCLTPTRELCEQTFRTLRALWPQQKGVVAVFGGSGKYEMQKALATLPDGVVATPGRLLAFVREGTCDLVRRCTFLVVDEVDAMFDLGFHDQVACLAQRLRPSRQTFCCSATLPPKVSAFARSALRSDDDLVRVGSCADENEGLVANEDVDHAFVVLRHSSLEEKLARVEGLFDAQRQGGTKILAFVSRKASVEEVVRHVRERDPSLRCLGLHGDMDAADRSQAVRSFARTTDARALLVATDVASRGLDWSHLDAVVNFDAPASVEAFVHRVGRVGRRGRRGLALTLLQDPADKAFARALVAFFRRSQSGNVDPGLLALAGASSSSAAISADRGFGAEVAPPPMLYSGGGKRPPPPTGSFLQPLATTTTTTTRMALQESSSLLITTAPAWVGPVSFVLDPTLIVIQFMMLCRVLLSWYPEINVNEVPYNLVAWPTEPVLRATRQVVPPAFGVDVSPIVWIAIASLARELLFGQQGFLVLLAR